MTDTSTPKSKPVTYARAVYSPSQLQKAHACLRSWVIRYIYGVKEDYTVSRGKVLGVVIHACAQAYMSGRTMHDWREFIGKGQQDVDAWVNARASYWDSKGRPDGVAEAAKELAQLEADAPQRALSGIHYLPKLADCAHILTEHPLKVNTKEIYDREIVFSDWSSKDLVLQAQDGTWFLYDYKSTKGKGNDPWYYVPTVEELSKDVQLLLYALDVMQNTGARELWCRWIYFYTGGTTPQAKNRDVHVTFEHVARELQYWLDLACNLTLIIDNTKRAGKLPDLTEFPFPAKLHDPKDSPCKAYTGCSYLGSSCHPPSSGNLITQLNPSKRKIDDMALEQRLAQQAAAGAPQVPGAQYAAPQQTMQGAPGWRLTDQGYAPWAEDPRLAGQPQAVNVVAFDADANSPVQHPSPVNAAPLVPQVVSAPVIGSPLVPQAPAAPAPAPQVIDTVGTAATERPPAEEKPKKTRTKKSNKADAEASKDEKQAPENVPCETGVTLEQLASLARDLNATITITFNA